MYSSQMYKCLIILFASTKYDMLELSPVSTKCTHSVAELFCRYYCPGGCGVALHSLLHSRPWIG
jgi:hypothetical protein